MTPAPCSTRLMHALHTTWPPAQCIAWNGWRLRRGDGGGKRVSAATCDAMDAPSPDSLAGAEDRMRHWGQKPLFQLLPTQKPLDAELARRGYALIDPVSIYAGATGDLTDQSDLTARVFRATTIPAMVEKIWQTDGIDAVRRAVMARVRGPSIVLLSRIGEQAAGAAFVAIDGDIAMLHAMTVFPALRRKGAARQLVTGAARWAGENGASTLAMAVKQDNVAACRLYETAGMEICTRYHYRIKN